MSPLPIPRDVNPVFQMLRKLLLGREHTTALRYPERIACRSQPAPNLPTGPCDRLSANYYCHRDARRSVQKPVVVVINSKTKPTEFLVVSSGKKEGVVAVGKKLPKTPGAARFY